jgi:cyclic beta-1,2-glucan synthetase
VQKYVARQVSARLQKQHYEVEMSVAPPISVFAEHDEPIPGELFSVDRLEQHAESLAAAQTVTSDPSSGKSLIEGVAENGRALLEYYRATARTVQQDQTITPAAQWLLDNFYIVEEQLREIRDDLPPSYYRKLPKLASGHLKGYPRVYGVAWAFVAHTDSSFDPEVLRRFVTAYQRVQPLSIGELWAVATTLRVVLVENLRRLAARIVLTRDARNEADVLADRLLGAGGQALVAPATVLREFEKKPLDRAFAVQLIQRLRDLDPKVGPILVWLDDRLAAQGTSADEIVRAEHQQQAAMSVTVRNVITSMRLASAFDWQTFFESVSLVDQTLRSGSNFGAMDFATRDTYRHAIEDLALGSKRSELEIAEHAVNRARQGAPRAAAESGQERFSDPGYYLIADGRNSFERDIGFRVPVRRKFVRFYVRSAVPGYLGTIALLTFAILGLPLLRCWELGVKDWQLALLAVVALIPASDLAIALINRTVTNLLGPRTLPRLEIKSIPENLRTIVVVPTLLTSVADVSEQIEQLEIHYLANSDGDLRFALLTDWVDAPTETLPSDEVLLAAAAHGIADLNKRHGPAAGDGNLFFLYHRRRVWNQSEEKWMGWERKRGKLHELNQLLRGCQNTTFIAVAGNPPEPVPGVRYVITLDADTRMPRGAAARLVGTMAHPLNRPTFSAEEGRVVSGYAIVQPRITPSLPTDRDGSRYQKVFSGPCGVDPYASAVSDVYQDLFHEGSYTGKGIYDLEMFETALAGKIPDNILLSHDLFEGIFARSALATDIEFFDEFPSHYEAGAARTYRWARGDWQLLPWILGGTAGPPGGRRFKIPIIGRWKMLDNLRRSLLAPSMFLTLVAGWLIPEISPWLWTCFIVAVIALPTLMPFLAGINASWVGISKRSHFRGIASDFSVGISQAALTATFLAYQAWLMADAIVRTLIRMLITRKHLLKWVTAAQAGHRVDLKLVGIFRRMAGGVALALAAIAAVSLEGHRAMFAAIPFVAVWVSSPAIAYWISLPPRRSERERLSPSYSEAMRAVARRTWRFFETFVTPDEHFLPPDNFQEDPKPVVAHRTSPTNIGLYLLSTLAARDFRWIGMAECVERIEATLQTIGRLEQFRGHLYNWYDTRDLHPMDPKYVSSVDSGNFAGHLLALASGCRELIQKPAVDTDIFAGIEDAIRLLREALAEVVDVPRIHSVTRRQLNSAVDLLVTSVRSAPEDAERAGTKIMEVAKYAHTVADIAQTLAQELGDAPSSALRSSSAAAIASAESQLRDAGIFFPWTRLSSQRGAPAGANPVLSATEWAAIKKYFRNDGNLADAPARFKGAIDALNALHGDASDGSAKSQQQPARINILIEAIRDAAAEAAELHRRLLAIAQRCEEMFEAMDFTFLFDETRKLFSIGYRATDGHLDPNCYDLLASEARLASFIAIAKGDVPSSHWFRMGRPLTPVGKGSALISWSGSMFEYLMPALIMRSPANSLLSQTYDQVVARQIEYGDERGVPWGISESAYGARDINFTYQYSTFGVPGLGLKRGLSEDLVIAPYATALAAMIDPAAALQNLGHLEEQGGRGVYGFYDSLDYTSSRLSEGQRVVIVRTYMAHHQGMTVVSLVNLLHGGAMCSRFHAVPIVQATELLLQERTPRDVLVARPRAEEVSAASHVRELVPPAMRKFGLPFDLTPRTALLSNGRYAVMVTSAGSGYSRWREIAITRWREDPTRDCWGAYFFLRDEQTGSVWSAGYQPSGVEPTSYEASFFEDHAEIVRRDRSVITALEIIVSSEDDAETRRISITNSGLRARDIQVTSYAELSLTIQAADVAHPAFANLFVETEFVADEGVLLATRRKRSDDEPSVWVAHVLVVEGDAVGELEYETDRSRFIGRARGLRNPVSIIDGRPLSNTVGSVLDPVMSLRRTVHVPPGSTVHLSFSTIVAATREEVLNLADKYRDARTYERTQTLAWTQAQVELHHLGVSAEEAQLFQRLANAVLYSDAALRPSPAVLSSTPLDRPALWAQGISGDLPIVVARIDDADDFDMIRQLLRAHEYWRMKQLSADVVIINEKATSYVQELQGSLEALVRGSQMRLSPDTQAASGKIFLLRGDLMSAPARAELQAVARAVLLSRRGTLAEQIARSQYSETSAPAPARPNRPGKRLDGPLQPDELQYFNGLGGFSENGREYTIVLEEGLRTPEPWINVIANPNFGFLVSESGSGFTWWLNSHENQITPWSNDHVIDPPGEAIYLRDESTGEVWTPTALPIRLEDATYVANHGQGYSRFRHRSHGISADLVQFVPVDDPIKISRLTLRNESSSWRRISVTAYVEWLLGSSRAASAPYIITETDPNSGAIFARSMWSGEFGGRVSFADLGGRPGSFTCDRTEFLGRNGSLERPAALEGERPLSGKLGAGFDPCAALQTTVELRPGASVEVRFLLGQTENQHEAHLLLSRYRTADLDKALQEVKHEWDDILGAVQVTTPDPSMDLMLNRWLLYQTLSCRVWARAAFYQLSGAYGFRDQLQDVLALTVAKRDVARQHLLRAAGRQFAEGDVQHWWHPPSGRGIRTRVSDDLLWLPYAVIHFVEATRDMSILDELVPFLEGEVLSEGQNESYFEPRISATRATLFEHCARALDRSLKVGEHGLPLMGTGDWNDGMNRVGQQGKGESVWLGWFLHTVLWEFAKIADARGERNRAETWRLHVSALKAALERAGWDGEWYRRAYYDDGTPLGSSTDDECRIDSIAQSWGIMSGAAEPARGARAMAAVEQNLIRRGDALILLLTPPFNHTTHDPGYIKGYVPGIRENGGQYSHAAVWTLIAFAAMGDGNKAGELFRMLNPVNRSNSRASIQRYKVEPYVMAGDIYGEAPHVGRGGWTWYTGSSGWLYRAGVEWILGFRVRGMSLSIDPCIPRNWPSYSVKFRYHSSVYNIQVQNPSNVARGVALTEVDGKILPGSATIQLEDDGATHTIRIVMG